MKLTFKTTVYACFIGCMAQSVVNNFAPLLFVQFHHQYNLPMSQITLLVTMNFVIQLLLDLLGAKYADRIGYRNCIVFAHGASAAGLALLTILPEIMDPFTGLVIAVVIYATGSGIAEVLHSPLVESCPTDNKEKAMSLLHSFYCWGHVATVIVSTLFFRFFGIENWKILTLLWAALPLLNGILFTQVPMVSLLDDGEKGMSIRDLFKTKVFWLMLVMMLCAGASELSVSQWASAFAEQGLGISKAAGDLAGPMAFAVFMGISRALYGKFGERIHLDRFMLVSSLLCMVAYLLTSLSPSPILSLIGCSLCGLSVGIMWPGGLSKAAGILPRGGTAMFAILALAGDLGCSVGPTLVGLVSGAASDNLKLGILAAVIFPVGLTICLLIFGKRKNGEG